MASAKTMIGLLWVPPMVFILVTAVFFVGIFCYDLVIGIVGTFIFGFYGITLSCVFAYERRRTLKVAMLAQDMDRAPFTILAQSTGCNDKQVRERAAWCINHGYLPGRIISGDAIVRMVDESQQEHAVECPNCGASFTYVGKIGECPYCGDYYPPKNKG